MPRPVIAALLALIAASALASARAQVPAKVARPPALAASTAVPTNAASASTRSNAATAPPRSSEVRVIEDDRVRIEETRQRGQLARITVSPKGGTLTPYEINVGAGGRDPSQDKSGAGQRVWSIFRF